jgi:plasmid stabilization system protein ParE
VTQVFWTPQAREDLQTLYDYISRDSLHYAGVVVDRVVEAMARIADFPESDRIVPELSRRDVREVLWRSYRIVYRLTTNHAQAHVLTVFRAERLFPYSRLGGGGPA